MDSALRIQRLVHESIVYPLSSPILLTYFTIGVTSNLWETKQENVRLSTNENGEKRTMRIGPTT